MNHRAAIRTANCMAGLRLIPIGLRVIPRRCRLLCTSTPSTSHSLIKAPTLTSMGFIDRVVPPAGMWIAVNQITAPKEAVPMIEANHVHITPNKVGAFPNDRRKCWRSCSMASNTSRTRNSRAEAGNPKETQVAQTAYTYSWRPPISPERQEQLRKAKEEQLHTDWAKMKRYRDDDAKVGPPAAKTRSEWSSWETPSPTAGFVRRLNSLRRNHTLIAASADKRAPQMLVRFRQDVVNLHPKVVVILAGTNDIAGNTGPSSSGNDPGQPYFHG